MKKYVLLSAAVASVLSFSGCNNQSGAPQSSSALTSGASSGSGDIKPSAENSVAVVNGRPITKALVQSIVAEMGQRSGGQNVPEDKVVDGLIARELLRQEAEKQNLAKDPAVSSRLDNAQRDVLVQAAVENFRTTAAVSDDEVKKEYDARFGGAKSTEYKARHILLDNEQAAKDAIAKLQKGAKFEDLAKKLSKDPSAKQNGGELGWFSSGQMVPEFSTAVAGLKNGEITPAPVKSKFGWHVIQREESREQAPPPLDAVKDQFRNMLLGQKLQKHVEDLKTAAKIERFAAPAPAKSEAPAEPSPPADGKAGQSLEAGKPVKPATPAAPAPAK